MSTCSGPPEPRLIRPSNAGDWTMIVGCVEARSVPTDADRAMPPWLIGSESAAETDVAGGSWEIVGIYTLYPVKYRWNGALCRNRAAAARRDPFLAVKEYRDPGSRSRGFGGFSSVICERQRARNRTRRECRHRIGW